MMLEYCLNWVTDSLNIKVCKFPIAIDKIVVDTTLVDPIQLPLVVI
jgi:hypothetical protein